MSHDPDDVRDPISERGFAWATYADDVRDRDEEDRRLDRLYAREAPRGGEMASGETLSLFDRRAR